MDLKKYITDYFANIDKRDFKALEASLAPGHALHNPMSPEPADLEGHIGMMKMMTGALDGKHILDVVFSDGHEWVCARGRWTGRHVGEFNGVPATGNKVEFSWINIQHVVNGKITEEYLEMNPAAIMQQIAPAPVSA